MKRYSLFPSLLFGTMMLLSSAANATLFDSVKFLVTLTTGPAAPSSYEGFLSYDDGLLSGSGAECMNKDGDPSCFSGFNTLSIVINGETFDQDDDLRTPTFPQLAFMDGILIGIDFDGLSDGSVPAGLVFGGVSALYVSDPFGNADQSTGTISFPTNSVPEPATLGILGLGLGLLGFRRRTANHA